MFAVNRCQDIKESGCLKLSTIREQTWRHGENSMCCKCFIEQSVKRLCFYLNKNVKSRLTVICVIVNNSSSNNNNNGSTASTTNNTAVVIGVAVGVSVAVLIIIAVIVIIALLLYKKRWDYSLWSSAYLDLSLTFPENNFYRASACNACRARYCYGKSACLSVYPSFSPSNTDLSRRMHIISSYCFVHLIGASF